jgi:hypothetical protein
MALTKINNNTLSAVTTLPAAIATGKVLQVVSAAKTDRQTTTSTNTWTDISGLSVSITPSSASNKILVLFTVNTASSINSHSGIKLLRGSTDIFVGDANGDGFRIFSSWRSMTDTQYHTQPLAGMFLDSPSTTSATTYKIQISGDTTVYVNRPSNFDSTVDSVQRTAGSSSITVMEIGV